MLGREGDRGFIKNLWITPVSTDQPFFFSSLSGPSAGQDLVQADAVVLGAPGRQGGMCGEMRLFLDSLAHLQVAGKGSSIGLLKARGTQTAAGGGGSCRRAMLGWTLICNGSQFYPC